MHYVNMCKALYTHVAVDQIFNQTLVAHRASPDQNILVQKEIQPMPEIVDPAKLLLLAEHLKQLRLLDLTVKGVNIL